jgi:hypothetical protein
MRPKKLEDLHPKERSLLLYVETCAVDNAGRMDPRKVNDDDRIVLDYWHKIGFVTHGRICADDCNPVGCVWVRLSETAWVLTHEERRARAARMWKNRGYTTTAEKRGETTPEPTYLTEGVRISEESTKFGTGGHHV